MVKPSEIKRKFNAISFRYLTEDVYLLDEKKIVKRVPKKSYEREGEDLIFNLSDAPSYLQKWLERKEEKKYIYYVGEKFGLETLSGVEFSVTKPSKVWVEIAKAVCELYIRYRIAYTDIRGSNILIGANDEWRLIDFGSCISLQKTGATTQAWNVQGQTRYMPPEWHNKNDIIDIGKVIVFALVKLHDRMKANVLSVSKRKMCLVHRPLDRMCLQEFSVLMQPK